MKQHQTPIGKNDEWITPKWITDRLGNFDLDPCSPIQRPWPIAATHYTIDDDGLSQTWTGRVWLNPPFNRRVRGVWMQRMAEHQHGTMLIPAATETAAFDTWVWKHASAILFLKKRPHFHYVTGQEAKANCGTAIVLVAYGIPDALQLEASGLPGKYFRL